MRMSIDGAGAAANVRDAHASRVRHGANIPRERDRRRNERQHHGSQVAARREQPMRDDRAAALDRRAMAEAWQASQNGSGDELVTPTRWYDARVPRLQACMRKLNRRIRRGSEQRIGAENDNRHCARNGRFGLFGSGRRQVHEVR
jgi:hypothetical protein